MQAWRSAVAAATVALAPQGAGCGSDDSAKFRDDYNATVNRLSKVNSEIGQATGAADKRSNAAVARNFARIAEAAQKARSRLSELTPPKDARDEFDALLSAMRDGVNDLRSASEAARRSDAAAFNRATKGLT